MRLEKEFIQLPIVFDAERMALEVARFTESEWEQHPQSYDGNSALILVSANGEMNSDYTGPMRPTALLQRCPYIQQVLASFHTVIGRSRLMRLAPGASVPPHCDIDYSWRRRVRIHVPIVTDPAVTFSSLGNLDVHMQAGEAWIFDNWKRHAVYNESKITRIHLVIDTTGSSDFWRLAERGWYPRDSTAPHNGETRMVTFDEAADVALEFERFNTMPVLTPAEMEAMLANFSAELLPTDDASTRDTDNFRRIAKSFAFDWQSCWSVFGDTPEGLPHYDALIRSFRKTSKALLGKATLPANDAVAMNVLSRWLGAATNASLMIERTAASAAQKTIVDTSLFDCPVFIVAAPRSGSTMLFEILSQNIEFWTIGDESHVEFESIRELRPASKGFQSNALDAEDLTPDIGNALVAAFKRKLKNSLGKLYTEVPAGYQQSTIRFLEKTPKNALRIPFLRALFPNALFIYLYRDARPNIASIMEAWDSRRFVTYAKLPGWTGPPWSLLLPQGWRDLKGKSLVEIAAWQWAAANEKILDDLGDLPEDRWCSISYESILDDRQAALRHICEFADVPFGPRMAKIAAGDVPNSRYTLSTPDPEKWRRHEAEIEAVMPLVTGTVSRIRSIS